ncbi:hypothetical protein T484DRAFT_1770129 [Baffinella frigidus]|nr:hypothetical protein T484DRAFT_1770129 [Cryptophyta sp. CCMP2293]
MEAERQSLCEIPRGLVVGEVNEMFLCGICDGLMREPRQASSCSEHIFCRGCYEAALSREACCPTCKQPVDASEPLHGFGPFEAMVNNTVVRCPTSISEMLDGNILQEPATSREASSSSACSRDSVQAPGVKKEPGVEEEAGDGGGNAGRAGVLGLSSSPFDSVHVGVPSNIL